MTKQSIETLGLGLFQKTAHLCLMRNQYSNPLLGRQSSARRALHCHGRGRQLQLATGAPSSTRRGPPQAALTVATQPPTRRPPSSHSHPLLGGLDAVRTDLRALLDDRQPLARPILLALSGAGRVLKTWASGLRLICDAPRVRARRGARG